jgi:hypothetical protein
MSAILVVIGFATVQVVDAGLVKRFGVNRGGVRDFKSRKYKALGRTNAGGTAFKAKASLTLDDGSIVDDIDVFQVLDANKESEYTFKKGDEIQASIKTADLDHVVSAFSFEADLPSGTIAVHSADGVFVENDCESVGPQQSAPLKLESQPDCGGECAQSERCVSLLSCKVTQASLALRRAENKLLKQAGVAVRVKGPLRSALRRRGVCISDMR